MTISQIENYIQRVLAIAEEGGAIDGGARAAIIVACVTSCGAPTAQNT